MRRILITFLLAFVGFITAKAQFIYGPSTVVNGETSLYVPSSPWCTKLWGLAGGSYVTPGYCSGGGACITFPFNPIVRVKWNCAPQTSGSLTMVSTGWGWLLGCNFGVVTKNITINSPSLAISAISGPTAVCLEETVTYSVTPTGTDISTIDWSFPSGTGGVIVSGQGTSSVEVKWTNSGAKQLAATPKSTDCGGTPQGIAVNVSGQPTCNITSSLLPSPSLNCGGSHTFNANISGCGAPPCGSYSWDVPYGFTVNTPGSATPSITVDDYSMGGTVTFNAVQNCVYEDVPFSCTQDFVIDPLPAPVEEIRGPKVLCVGSTATYYIDDRPNTDQYQWSLNPGSAGTIFPSTTVSNVPVTVTWTTAGVHELRVRPYNTFCNDGPLFTQQIIVHPNSATASTDSVSQDHSALMSSPNTRELIVNHCLNSVSCADKTIEKATINLLFNLGEDYEYGTNAFNTSVDATITGYNSISGGSAVAGATYTTTLAIDQNAPEALFHKDVTSVYDQVYRWEVSYTYSPHVVSQSDVGLEFFRKEDFALDARTANPVVTTNAPVASGNQMTFSWNTSCMDYENYEFQLLRLFNRNPNKTTQTDITTGAIDWSEALSIETHSAHKSLTITVAEGSGYYAWRVRPIGDAFENGFGNSNNWGKWSNHSPIVASSDSVTITGPIGNHVFFYNQFDDLKNWNYDRTFTEGSVAENKQVRIAEGMIFANSLNHVEQTQRRLAEDDQVLANQSVYDYSGRQAIQSMMTPVPTTSQTTLGFVSNMMQSGSGNKYTAADFDQDGNYKSPSKVDSVGAFAYFSNNNSDLTIPTSEGYPYTRTLYYPDASSRVMEEGGLGKVHRIQTNPIAADSRTKKTYYSGVSDDELIRVFGDEAPDNDEVILKIVLDADKVTTGEYVGKDGKTLANFLIKTGDIDYNDESKNPLLGLSSQDTAGFTVADTISNATPFTPYGNVLTKTRTFVNIPTTSVTLNYQLDPQTVEDICMNYCVSCDYWVQFLIHRTDSPHVALLDTTFSIPPDICDSVEQFTFSHNFNAGVGTYSFTRKILTNTIDSLNPTTGGNLISFLEKHEDSLSALYDSTINTDLADVWAFLDTTGGNPPNIMGLYHHLGIDTTVNNPDEVYEDSLAYITIGCDSIGIPITFCPANECDPDSVDFAGYFIDRWADSTHYYSTGGGTHAFLNNDYTSAQFNKMIKSMLVDANYDCDTLWECWKSLVESYPSMYSIGQQDTNFTFNMVEQFLNCTGRRWKMPNPGTTTAHGANYSSGGYLSHAFAYMHDTLYNNCECVCLAQGITPGNPCTPCPALTTVGQMDTLWMCANALSPGITLDPNVHAATVEDSCKAKCENRRTAFRNAAIRMFHNNQMYVEGDQYYLVYDTTWGQVYVPNTSNPRTTQHINDSTDVTQAQLDCMIDSLVQWCKDGCSVTVFNDSVGTQAEILAIQQRLTYLFELELPDPVTQECDSGYYTFSPNTGGGGGGGMSTFNFSKAWDHTFGGTRDDRLYDVKTTVDGNYIAVGYSDSDVSGNKGTGNIAAKDGWIVKFDDLGNVLWEMTIGSELDDVFQSVVELQNGNFLVGGYSNSPAGANKSSGNFGGYDYWLLEIDPTSSTIVLDQTYGGRSDDYMAAAIETLNNGHYLMVGYSNSGPGGNKSAPNYGGNDYWVIEVDQSGGIIWDMTYGGRMDDILRKVVDLNQGEYTLAGYSNSPRSQGKGDGNKTSNNMDYDYWILKIDGNTNGSIIWQRAIQGEQRDMALDIVRTDDGHFAIAGRSNSPAGIDKTQNSNKYDYWVVKLRNDGTIVLWDRTLGGSNDDIFDPDKPICFDIEMASDGGFVIAGSSPSPVSGQKTEPAFNQMFDYWMVRLDASGTQLWDKVIGGEEVDAQTVVRILDEDCILAGGFSSSPQNPAYGHHGDIAYGSYDYWVVRYCMTEEGGGSGQDTCDFPKFCFRWVPYDEIAPPDSSVHVFMPYTCEEVTMNSLLYQINQFAWQYKQDKLDAFRDQYMNICANRDNIKDKFWLTYGLAYHHYTLFYYDRSSRLIKTVPPQGVDFLQSPYNRNTQTDHSMETFYFYNSVDQVDSIYVVDKGGSKFYYDAVGNKRFSQNDQQRIDGEYNYIKYDEQSRIIEIGLSDLNPMNFFGSTFLNDPAYPPTGYERTYNVYSTPASGAAFIDGSIQRFLTNRISYSYTENGGTHIFSYDAHGNVEWLSTWTPFLGMNYIRFSYDLVSGNTSLVEYNPSLVDELYHKYDYDSDNRIRKVMTSIDKVIWDTDLTYSYSPHSLLKRKTIGEDKIQGVDNIFNIQGWIKAINFPTLELSKDPGSDNVLNRFAPDAYGQLLGFYDNDWNRAGSDYLSSNSDIFQILNNRNLYSGDISTWSMNTINSSSGLSYDNVPTTFQYRYDEAIRLKSNDIYYWDSGSWDPTLDYQSRYYYDGNGNLDSLIRNGYAASGNVAMDQIKYNYQAGTNKLLDVSDPTALSSNYTTDIDNQVSGNYAYDATGNLVRDQQALIDSIDWLSNGKIKRIYFNPSATNDEIEFYYDPAGNRIAKVVKPDISDTSNFVYTLYVKDMKGNTIANYSRENALVGGLWEATIRLERQGIFGSQRAGQLKNTQVTEKTTNWQSTTSYVKVDSDDYARVIGKKEYGLADHLGNVRLVFSDIKLSNLDGSNNPIASSFSVDLISLNNYYPFGSMMVNRSYNSSEYQYGFNGKEKDDEIKGNDNSLNFGERLYDPRIARWLSVDPLSEDFPSFSPYNFAENNPIVMIDPNGKSGEAVLDKKNKTITVHTKFVFYGGEAKSELSQAIANEIAWQYNDANAKVMVDGVEYNVKFKIHYETVTEAEARTMAASNTSARVNFIRVEENNTRYNRSFNEIGENNGFMNTDDNLGTSTTAPHEAGHGYGLLHSNGDQRGMGRPDIMAARGTAVDAEYTYDPSKGATTIDPVTRARSNTVNPKHRRVTQQNITDMFSGVAFDASGKADIGTATNKIYDVNGNESP